MRRTRYCVLACIMLLGNASLQANQYWTTFARWATNHKKVTAVAEFGMAVCVGYSFFKPQQIVNLL